MQETIINYYPPVVSQIREIQQIAKAEDIEFNKLGEHINRILQNMFLATADEFGIRRIESMLGILPKASQSIEERKRYIYYRLNRRRMSLSELSEMLSGHLGGVVLKPDYDDGILTADIGAGVIDLHEIYGILDEVLPLWVCILFETAFTIQLEFKEAKKEMECKTAVCTWDTWNWNTGTELTANIRGKELFQTSVTIKKDYWRLDGTYKLDGSRVLDAEVYEGSEIWFMGKSVTTRKAKKKILLARAGQCALPKIAQMVFGSGGVNSSGEVLEADEEQESLNTEIFRKNIDKYEIINDTQICYYCTLAENELAGMAISEIALADAEGDLIAIQNCASKGKDNDWEITFKINDMM